MEQKLKTVMGIAVSLLATAPAFAGWPGDPAKCKADAVKAGSVCIDKYEASVWEVPNATTTNKGLVKKIQNGRVKLTDLTAGGAIQRGLAATDDYPCTDNGQNCADKIFAVSIAGVKPSASLTWFQAQEACTNSRKRLPSNAEWQAAANGSPDPGGDNGSTDCNTVDDGSSVTDPASTGSRSSCVSARGAYDMVGNVWEWVADWLPVSTACPDWGAFSDDYMCLAGASTVFTGPGAVVRGGDFNFGSQAGPLAVGADAPVWFWSESTGFRCAR